MTRPVHEPIAARCESCGAPISIQDEKARLVVCGNCGARHELTGVLRDTLAFLNDRPGREVRFDLQLGDAFRWKGARYEVVARLCWVEDGSMKYATRVYALYHPRRPLLYLDEYHGSWGLSGKTHVMPVGRWRDARPGATVRTHDGATWRLAEAVERHLAYVDGCLPWLAEVGDAVLAWEFIGAGGATYEVETTRSGEELEFNRGQQLSPAELSRAGLSVRAKGSAVPQFVRKRQATMVALVGFFGLLGAGALSLAASLQGTDVLEETLTAAALSREVSSAPFTITEESLVRLTLSAPLDDAWMAVDYALLSGDDEVVHVSDADLSYYSGVEGGESWSEGSKTSTTLLSGIVPGTYRLHLRALSNRGETEQASESMHPLRVELRQGARNGTPAMLAFLVGGGFLVLGIYWRHRISEE